MEFRPPQRTPQPTGSQYAQMWGESINNLGDTFTEGVRQRRLEERQAMLDRYLAADNERKNRQFAIDNGTPIDPNATMPIMGNSSMVPSAPVASPMGYSGDMTAQPLQTSLIERFNQWRAGGMKPGGARAEFMPALGKDDRKMFQDQFKPQPSYVIPNLDGSGNVSGFTPLPNGAKPAGGFAKPPTPPTGTMPGGKQLPPASVLSVNDGESVARMLPDVEMTIDQNADLFGPMRGRMFGANPYNTQAQTVDARMRSASQAFGRFMEGGVLRKEDEEKYRKMFPQLSDTPDVAKNKLGIVRQILQTQSSSQVQSLGNSGYDVSGFQGNRQPQGVRQFQSLQEAEAANLPPGTKITIGGRSATVQ